MNKSFCSLAWLGVTVDPDGSLRPCCVSTDKILKDDGSEYNLGVDSLNTIYQSNYYKDLRQKMLDGITIPGCQTCYSNEEYGRESRRLINNQIYKDYDYKAESLNLKYMDLRLGNLCNLKCRMCSPMNSSLVEEEFTNHKDSILNKFYLQSLQKNHNWFDSTVFDNNINSNLHTIDTLYLTGGEPTLIKKNYDILQRLIDIGQHKKVSLIINTNMTNTNPKFYELIKQFKSVVIQMSIDAVGELSSYIRYPTNFSVVEKTLLELINLEGNIKLIAGPVVQTLNLNALVELFDYFENINQKYRRSIIDIRPGYVYNPLHLNMIYLPKDFKIECYRKIHMWMFEKCKYQSASFKNFITSLKKKCYEDNYNKVYLQEFMEYNSYLDNIRNMKLENYNPELYKVINNYV